MPESFNAPLSLAQKLRIIGARLSQNIEDRRVKSTRKARTPNITISGLLEDLRDKPSGNLDLRINHAVMRDLTDLGVNGYNYYGAPFTARRSLVDGVVSTPIGIWRYFMEDPVGAQQLASDFATMMHYAPKGMLPNIQFTGSPQDVAANRLLHGRWPALPQSVK